MIGVYVSVPIACFRKGLAREYLETEMLPPPSTCYGFFLSLVGETDRLKHVGVRVAPLLLNVPETSVVLRTVWRVKKRPLGSAGNTRPDYQQLLSNIELVLWLDSSEDECEERSLEQRVLDALDPQKRGTVQRFGGLSLGESTHLVDCVSLINDDLKNSMASTNTRLDQLDEQGLIGLPVWVDHVGSAGTVHVVGDLSETVGIVQPKIDRMPKIVSSYN